MTLLRTVVREEIRKVIKTYFEINKGSVFANTILREAFKPVTCGKNIAKGHPILKLYEIDSLN